MPLSMVSEDKFMVTIKYSQTFDGLSMLHWQSHIKNNKYYFLAISCDVLLVF